MHVPYFTACTNDCFHSQVPKARWTPAGASADVFRRGLISPPRSSAHFARRAVPATRRLVSPPRQLHRLRSATTQQGTDRPAKKRGGQLKPKRGSAGRSKAPMAAGKVGAGGISPKSKASGPHAQAATAGHEFRPSCLSTALTTCPRVLPVAPPGSWPSRDDWLSVPCPPWPKPMPHTAEAS